MDRELSKEELAELLREAERAHAEYEREDWPAWYGGYIVDRLARRGAA